MNSMVNHLRSQWNSSGGISIQTRKIRLLALKKSILTHEALISRALKEDLGKSLFESFSSEIGFVLGDINYALKNLGKWTKIKKVSTPLSLFPARSFIVPEPLGVVLIIAPWNYPFMLALSPLVGALAAGNRIILKPSEISSKTTEVMKLILGDVFSNDEVSVVEGGVEETQELLKEKFDHIFFTGSTPVGKIVMKAAAEHLTPVTLELGGKSPFLVHETANLDKAAKRCVWGKFMNAGQTCVAPDYALVHENQSAEFLDRLKFHLQEFYSSQPDTSPDYGRMISHKHFDRLSQLIPQHNIVAGGGSQRDQKYLAPTILKNILWTDKIMDDEIFGPILPVITYKNFEETLHQIQSRPKPLAFYFFAENQSIVDQVLEKVSFGGGCINDTIIHLANHELPFGGVGASGMGSYHGKKSFEIFTHYKAVVQNTTKVDIPVRYPPYKGKLGWLKFFIG